MEILKPHNNDIVKKSDMLVKARYKLNPLALKFVTTIIANLRRSDEVDKKYVFKVADFANLIGVNYHDIYAELEDAVEELLKKPLHIKEENGWLKVNWVSSARYNHGEGTISFRIDQDLRPYLLELKNRFLQYRLENILKLRSGYSIRMYEILKDWFNQIDRYNGSKRVEKIVELKWLREVLQVPKSYQYGNSSGIKYRILEKAQKELKQHTDITFDFEEIKTGRKVTHIKFLISKNPQRVERKESKKLIDENKYEELEQKLNAKYRGKMFQGKNGLKWTIQNIKVLNDEEAEITATDLEHTETFIKKISELREF